MGALDDDAAPYLPAVRALLRTAVSERGTHPRRVPRAPAARGRERRARSAASRTVPRSARSWSPSAPLPRTTRCSRALPITPDVLQWHFDEVHVLPPGAVQLASSPACEHQAFRLGRLAWGIQFHIETDAAIVRAWAAEDAGELADYDLDAIVERAVDASTTTSPRCGQPFAAGVRRRRARSRVRPGAARRADLDRSADHRSRPRSAPPWPPKRNAARGAAADAGPASAATMAEATDAAASQRPAAGPARVRDGERAAELLAEAPLAWWDVADNAPVDDDAASRRRRARTHRRPRRRARGPRRLVAAPRAAAELRDGARPRAPSCARGCLPLLGVSTALAEHLVAHPDDWRALVGPARPARHGAARLRAAGRRRPERPDDRDGRRARHRHRRRRASPRCGAPTAASWSRSPGATWPASWICARSPSALADLAGLHAAGRAAVAAAELPDERRAVPARDHRDGQDRRARAQLRLRRRRRVRRRAGPIRRRRRRHRRARCAPRPRWPASTMRLCREVAWEVDAALRPEGKDGAAGAHAGQPRGLLPAVGEHVGVPGAAQGAAGRRRPRARRALRGRSIAPLVWTAAERPDFVADVRAMRRRVVAHIPPAVADREIKLGPRRPARRRVRGAAAAARARPRRRVAARRAAPCRRWTRCATAATSAATTRVSLTDAYRFLRATEHRLQLRRLRRTHVVPDDPTQLDVARAARWASGPTPRRRARGVGGRVGAARARGAPPAREAVLPAAARGGGAGAVGRPAADARRGRPAAGGARLRRPGAGAAAHRVADRPGCRAAPRCSARCCRCCCRTSPTRPTRTPGCSPTGGCPTSSARRRGTCGCCATRAQVASRLAYLLGTSRYVARMLGRAPEALRMLAADSELRAARAGRGRARRCATPPRARDDPGEAVAAVRAVRRHELLRIAFADLLGLVRRRRRCARRSAPPPRRRSTSRCRSRCVPSPPSAASTRCRCGSRSSRWAASAAPRSATAPTPT